MKNKICIFLVSISIVTISAREESLNVLVNFDNGYEISVDTATPRFDQAENKSEISPERVRYDSPLKKIEFKKSFEANILRFRRNSSSASSVYVEFDNHEQAKLIKRMLELNPSEIFFDSHDRRNDFTLSMVGELPVSWHNLDSNAVFIAEEDGKLISLQDKAKELLITKELDTMKLALAQLDAVENQDNGEILDTNRGETKLTNSAQERRKRRRARASLK